MATKTMAAIALAWFVLPAAAQTPGEDYAAAQEIFMAPKDAEWVTAIEGEWLPLSLLADAPRETPDPASIDGYLADFCGTEPRRGYIIEQTSPMGFSMSRENVGGDEFTQYLDWASGSSFRVSFDTDAFASFFFFSDNEAGQQRRAAMLAAQPGFVDVFQPADDILVIVRAGHSEILGRCR